jgi:hypothetical protein
MSKVKVKKLLSELAIKNEATIWLNESKSTDIADKLIEENPRDIEAIKKIIESGSFMIKESIDFSDTDYILSQILDAINED